MYKAYSQIKKWLPIELKGKTILYSSIYLCNQVFIKRFGDLLPFMNQSTYILSLIRFLSIVSINHISSSKMKYDVIDNLIRAYFIIDVNTTSREINKYFFKSLSNSDIKDDISGAIVNKCLNDITTLIPQCQEWIQANIRSELNYIKVRNIPVLPRFEYSESSENKGASMFQVLCAVSQHYNNINTYKIGVCIQLCYEIHTLNQHEINCVAACDLNTDNNLDDHIIYVIGKIYSISDTYGIFKIMLLFAIAYITYMSPHVSPKMKTLISDFI